jgi:membrane protease subunit (stomatin/prohibitin family)
MARRFADTILYRFPVHGQEIKNDAQLIVRESQTAVFVYEGQVADVFTPGRYTIDGGNTPILSKTRSVEIRFQFADEVGSLFR